MNLITQITQLQKPITKPLKNISGAGGLSQSDLKIEYLLFQLEHCGTIEIYGMQLYPSQVTFLEYCLWRDNQTEAITEDTEYEILN